MMTLDTYIRIKVIGRGSYGEVWLGRHRSDKKLYVLKRMDLQKASKRERTAAEQEAKLLSKLRHPNIVSYKDSFETENSFLYITMQYCEGGDLYTKLKEQKGALLEQNQVVEWFIQIAMALQYMHERCILHRDLKTQNIFLTKNQIIKVGDLGIAKKMKKIDVTRHSNPRPHVFRAGVLSARPPRRQDSVNLITDWRSLCILHNQVLDSNTDMATTLIGTPYYMSPELFSNKPYNQKSDVWALGCCVYEMTTLRHAFNAKDMNSLVYKILRGKMPAMPRRYNQELVVLITQMLNQEPEKRPSVNRVLRDPFIKRNIQCFLEKKKAGLRPSSNNKGASSLIPNFVSVNKNKSESSESAVISEKSQLVNNIKVQDTKMVASPLNVIKEEAKVPLISGPNSEQDQSVWQEHGVKQHFDECADKISKVVDDFNVYEKKASNEFIRKDNSPSAIKKTPCRTEIAKMEQRPVDVNLTSHSSVFVKNDSNALCNKNNVDADIALQSSVMSQAHFLINPPTDIDKKNSIDNVASDKGSQQKSGTFHQNNGAKIQNADHIHNQHNVPQSPHNIDKFLVSNSSGNSNNNNNCVSFNLSIEQSESNINSPPTFVPNIKGNNKIINANDSTSESGRVSKSSANRHVTSTNGDATNMPDFPSHNSEAVLEHKQLHNDQNTVLDDVRVDGAEAESRKLRNVRRRRKHVSTNETSSSTESVSSSYSAKVKLSRRPPSALYALKQSNVLDIETESGVLPVTVPDSASRLSCENVSENISEKSESSSKSSSTASSRDELQADVQKSLPNQSARERRRNQRASSIPTSDTRPPSARLKLVRPSSQKSTTPEKQISYRQPSLADDSTSSADEDKRKNNDKTKVKREKKEITSFLAVLDTTLKMNKDADKSEDETDFPPEECALSEETPLTPVTVKPGVDTLSSSHRLIARITLLRKDCQNGIGHEKLTEAYNILDKFEDDAIEPQLIALLGKKDFDLYAGKIWQLKFCEDSVILK